MAYLGWEPTLDVKSESDGGSPPPPYTPRIAPLAADDAALVVGGVVVVVDVDVVLGDGGGGSVVVVVPLPVPVGVELPGVGDAGGGGSVKVVGCLISVASAIAASRSSQRSERWRVVAAPLSASCDATKATTPRRVARAKALKRGRRPRRGRRERRAWAGVDMMEAPKNASHIRRKRPAAKRLESCTFGERDRNKKLSMKP